MKTYIPIAIVIIHVTALSITLIQEYLFLSQPDIITANSTKDSGVHASISAHQSSTKINSSSSTTSNPLGFFPAETICIFIKDNNTITQHIGRELSHLLVKNGSIENVLYRPESTYPDQYFDLALSITSDISTNTQFSGINNANGVIWANLSNNATNCGIKLKANYTANYSGTVSGVNFGHSSEKKIGEDIAKELCKSITATIIGAKENNLYSGKLPPELKPDPIELELPPEIPQNYVSKNKTANYSSEGGVTLNYKSIVLKVEDEKKIGNLSRIPELDALVKDLQEKGWDGPFQSWGRPNFWQGTLSKGAETISFTTYPGNKKRQGNNFLSARNDGKFDEPIDYSITYAQSMTSEKLSKIIQTNLTAKKYSPLAFLFLLDELSDNAQEQLLSSMNANHFKSAKVLNSVLQRIKN